MSLRKIAMVVALMFALTFSLLAAAADPCSDPVSTTSGMVLGRSSPDTASCAWLGIPYAAPPVGELRWKAPQPEPAWTDVRPALAFRNRCMQQRPRSHQAAEGMSEDCLYLNIWRPEKFGTFPVMFWIHGGGLVGGSASLKTYQGGRLAEAGDVVVVTINYRLGVFGFLASPALRAEDPHQSTGNYGMLDQVAALQWVHDNIRNFGGDPANVTIFGESAGGWSVCNLLASPAAHGMFERAILESGLCTGTASLEHGYAQAQTAAAKVGCKTDDLACLRAVPAPKLMARVQESPVKAGFPWAPHHDGYFLTDTPLAMIRAGHYNHVPFLAGSNRDEINAVVFLWPKLNHARRSQYGRVAQESLELSPPDLDRLLALYPLSQFDQCPKRAFGHMLTDAGLGCPTYLGLAATAARREPPGRTTQQPGAYYYRFDYDEMRFGKHLGALHGMEVPFVFNQVGSSPRAYSAKALPAASALDRIIVGYWTNFAKTGNPNGPGLPAWPEFKPEDPKVQVLDTTVRTEPVQTADRCGFWDQYWQTHPYLNETLGKPQKKKSPGSGGL